MKVNEIAIERKFNLGNFEMQMIRITVCPEQHEQSEDWNKLIEEITVKLDEKIKELNIRLNKKIGV